MRLSRLFAVSLAAGAAMFGALGAEAQQPLKIRLGWAVPVANWGSVLYEKTDLMVHYGKSYVVEPVHFEGSSREITALAAGELEIADLAYSSFAIAVQNAGMADLKIVADEFQDGAKGHYSGEFLVLKDGPVKTVEDLKGKVVANVAVGSAVDIAERVMLRKHGLEDKRDYTLIEAAFPNMGPMLLEKKADLVSAAPPFAFEPKLRAMSRSLFTMADALGGPTETGIWAAHAGYIEQNRAALVDFLEDAVRAVHFFVDPKNHAEAVRIAAKITKAPAANLDWVFTAMDDYHDPNMLPDLAGLQRAIDAQQEVGFLKTKLDVKTYAELSLVQEAAARIK